MSARLTGRNRVSGHWFWLALPVLLAISFALARGGPAAAEASALEAVLLFDWCVTVPVLYALCYRQMPLPRLVLRMLGIAVFGVWLVSWMVPEEAQALVPQLVWVRWAGVAVLALIELRLLWVVVRIAFSGKGTAADIERASGAPPLLAKLMLLEARFWRAVWTFVRGR